MVHSELFQQFLESACLIKAQKDHGLREQAIEDLMQRFDFLKPLKERFNNEVIVSSALNN